MSEKLGTTVVYVSNDPINSNSPIGLNGPNGPNKEKQTICLCMIVKNEGHIIKETLENVYKYVDTYCINDTGSTDGTQDMIRDFFKSKGIDGEVIDHEYRTCNCHPGHKSKRYTFFDYGANRSFAMEKCIGRASYIWMMDADDRISGNMIIPHLTHDCYNITFGKGFTWKRTQFFKNDSSLNWHYNDELHEYATCDKKGYTIGSINGDFYVDYSHLGSRSSDPLKYLNDAKVFEELLLDKPNNDRYTFYCAQSYYDYGDKENALLYYRKRIAIGGWYEEVFYSYYRVALLLEMMSREWSEVEKAYMDAYNFCKLRAEPLYHIARHYRLANDFKKCYEFAKIGIEIPFPQKCLLFMHKDIYDYKMADELSLGAYYMDNHCESLTIMEKMMRDGFVPESEMPRLMSNIAFNIKKINERSLADRW